MGVCSSVSPCLRYVCLRQCLTCVSLAFVVCGKKFITLMLGLLLRISLIAFAIHVRVRLIVEREVWFSVCREVSLLAPSRSAYRVCVLYRDHVL